MAANGHVYRGELTPALFRVDYSPSLDIDQLALVFARAYAQRCGLSVPEAMPDIKKLAEISDRLAKPGAWFHTANQAEKLVGFVLGHPSETEETINADPAVEYLALLMVDPLYWGRGAGGMLLDAAVRTARAKGKKQMVLWTAQTNDQSRRLYENRGYRLTGLTRSSRDQGLKLQYRLNL